MTGRAAVLAALLLALPSWCGPLAGQQGGASTPPPEERSDDSGRRPGPPRTLTAVPLRGSSPVLDGRIVEPAWREGGHARAFVQFEPDEGAAPSHATEAWVLYGPDALWVAFRAHDSAPDSIAGQLTRRDEHSYSDELIVAVDSHLDRRTAYVFSANPVGVRKDIYMFEDGREDSSWDPVWDVATAIDEDGWSAEFRIPYGQLRFSGAERQRWGLNLLRRIARHDETSVWSPLSQQVSGVVSQFGTLEGLEGLESPNRLEVEPYTMARMHREAGDAADPFHRSTDLFVTAGADLEYGVTNDLTLNLTLNPDFGQVEADPGQVNLTAFETFFPEKRPFFLEGRNIFDLSLGGGGNQESLFYSRRIGRAPQGRARSDGGYAAVPDNSTILGAWKLSGKTGGGWSVGVLHAMTAREDARIQTGGGERLKQAVEPLTNYSVARLQKDFRDGRSAVGFINTATFRDGAVADALELNRSAWSGGLDFRHRFGAGGDYQVQGNLLGSWIGGSTEALERAQRSSVRYFQRPDASHVDFDPSRTSLGGWAGSVSVQKIGGGFWRSSWFLETRSPGFEVNDIGFQTKTDYWVTGGFVGYHKTDPGERLRRWRINLNGFGVRTYGGERVDLGGNVNGGITFHNLWGADMGIQRSEPSISTNLLRGGPSIRTEGSWNGWGGIHTDSRRGASGRLNWNWGVTPANGSRELRLATTLDWRPSSSASASLGPFVRWSREDRQWVEKVDGDFLFGRLNQRTVGLTTRLEMSFTPDLSVQVYAQPFLSAGRYDEFKVVADPAAEAYADRFRLVDAVRAPGDGTGGSGATGGPGDPERYLADLDGDGSPESFDDPDFNSLQFRSNVVVRWEYRPGSTLFLVWAQVREGDGVPGDHAFGRDLEGLFGLHPTNVLMLKASYWLSP